MRNINFIRLRNFIYFHAPNDKKKRYMNNKLDELEEQVEKMKCCANCKYRLYGAKHKCTAEFWWQKCDKWEITE